MGQLKAIKLALVSLWIASGLIWAVSDSLSKPAQQDKAQMNPETRRPTQDFVGAETCKGCHEEAFNSFSRTMHANLKELNNWKDRVHGCESCHGPGRAHVEAGGDKSLIRTFENESPKQISDNCLYCHSGREEHNNFRRGEHWRNDVGCIDCHDAHPPAPAPTEANSITFISESQKTGPGLSSLRMLKMSEPQLCLECHQELKSAFSMPFRHRVLEGAIRCSDCHNPHGGFELKQTRLAVGADAPCIKCHTHLQGPFVFEHAPLRTEGCAICHDPHGSSNPRMLRRSEVFQLCIECHSDAHQIGAPNTPSFHNLATARFRNCTTCHVKIHGSHIDPVFFR
jgi:predicted CXXCH cytochrome family protein